MLDANSQNISFPPLSKYGTPHHLHGFNIPLFWLKSSKSCGIGDFSDLKAVIDWCASIKWQIIQLLPLCDTWDQASPYSPISAASLNWAYIDVSNMLSASEQSTAHSLNRLDRVVYSQVRIFKRAIIERHCREIGLWKEARLFSDLYPWVKAYGRFCSLKEIFCSTSWWTWPPCDEKSALFCRHYRFFVTAQYLAYQQLRSVKEYAESRSVLLKGDLPILMSRDSCDVWRHPDWFDVAKEVGAPPDAYAPNGQNWGLPPYLWQEMRRADYSWWRERLTMADLCFHLYRLDHIAGFFRLWSIDRGKSGKMGNYIPLNLDEAEQQGRENLTAILSASRARPIGEDLGTIPPAVRKVMEELDIPGTRVLRWERDWQKGGAFIPIDQYPRCSVSTVSTHDSQTLSQWWRDNFQESSLYAKSRNWNWSSELSNDWRMEILRQSHSSNSILHINLLLEYLSLFPTLAPGVAEQRINTPGTVSLFNWTCRCPVDFDEIASHIGLAEIMRDLIPSEKKESSRL